MKPFELGGRVTLTELAEVAERGRPVHLTPAVRRLLRRSRARLESAVASGAPVYGVNTGFGELASRRIPASDVRALQKNLVLSHACGAGEPLRESECRAILFLRANELSRGHSGCRPALVELMAQLLNRGISPVIPSRGSVGASGDLAPQAHAALLLIGLGRARRGGREMEGAKALAAAGLKPLALEAKEGLSLVNGTQAMQAVGGLALRDAARTLSASDIAGAMSLEAMTGTPVPFDARLSVLKAHPGQVKTAARLRRLLAGSQIRESHRRGDPRVQDPYSLRCMPQVHGAVADALAYALRVVETEMDSVTDNPILTGGAVLSGGNFHGQALSMAYDHAALAMTVLGGISERRIFQLVSGQAPRLSPFLASDPGLESGYMMLQVTAAALASENKVLAHPASADSIPTSAFKEDFVSMGMGAALKFRQITVNSAQIAAIELLAAAQGLEAHKPLKPGKGVAKAFSLLRAEVPASRGDEPMSEKMRIVKDMVLRGELEQVAGAP